MSVAISFRPKSVDLFALPWTTRWDKETALGDWSLAPANGGVTAGGRADDEQIASAIIISLFTDRRAPKGFRPDMADRRGWWGDTIAADGEAPEELGSHLWLLRNSAVTDATAELARAYVREALAWLVRDRIAARVTIETGLLEYPRRGVWIDVQVAGRDGALMYDRRFERLWREI